MSPHERALIANLGAEEGPDWASHAARPAVATTTRLWRLLFAQPTRLLGEAAPAPAGWPAALGPEAEQPAFPWLASAEGATAWLVDESAEELARRHALPLVGPPPARVMRVHDKAFAVRAAEQLQRLPAPLAGLIRVLEPEQLRAGEACVAELSGWVGSWPSWTGGRFTLKPRLGSSGRGRVAGDARRPAPAELLGALPRLAQRGGAVLEPWLARSVDLSVQLHVAAAGQDTGAGITLLGSLEQLVSASGLYLGHLGEIDSRGRVASGSQHDEAMREAAVALAERAREAGYFGPCGVDGFAFRLGQEQSGESAAREWLRPLVELNARFTAGIVMLGLLRRALPQLRERLRLEPGERRAFLFALAPPPGLASWRVAQERLGEGVCLVPLADPAAPAQPALLFAPTLDGIHALLAQARPPAPDQTR